MTVQASDAASNTPAFSAQSNLISFPKTIPELVESFGLEETANFITQQIMEGLGSSVKDMDNFGDLPEGIKQLAYDIIDQAVSESAAACPCSSEVTEVAENSDAVSVIMEFVKELIQQIKDIVENDGPTYEPGTAADAAAAGIPGREISEEPAEGEGSLSAAEATADAALGGLLGVGEGEDEKKQKSGGGGGSFLEALADAMGKVQGQLLEQAREQSDIMVLQSKKDGDPELFTLAQAAYSAKMQMFNIYSTQVATSLKTIGEAMSSIARKQ